MKVRASLIRIPNFSFIEKMMTLQKTKRIFGTLCLVFDEDPLEIQTMAKIRAGCSTSPPPPPDEPDPEDEDEDEIDPNL